MKRPTRKLRPRVALGALLGLGFATGLAIAQFASPADERWAADDALRARVDSAIALHRALQPFDIVVTVDRGVARLDGSVDDALERELALRLARSVDGVRSVDNHLRIEPDRARWLGLHSAMHPDGPDDRALALAVRSHLRWHRDTRALDLDVQCWNGHVRLRGSADTLRERHAAERIAARIAGVQSIDNRIAVEAPLAARGLGALGRVGAAASDRWINAKVRSALLFTPGVNGLDLDVETHDGRVRLAGIAANRTELDLAVEIASAVRGVRSIDTDAVHTGT